MMMNNDDDGRTINNPFNKNHDDIYNSTMMMRLPYHTVICDTAVMVNIDDEDDGTTGMVGLLARYDRL